MSKLSEIMFHVFLPNRCMFCDHAIPYDARICDNCDREASRTDLSRCLICGQAECRCQNYFRYFLAPFYYEMGAERAIKDLKFNGNYQNAKKLAFYMVNCIKQAGLDQTIDGIIPAPLYQMDLKKRGYNQAALLAKEIAIQLDKPFYEDILLKVKQTKKQHELNQAERAHNLQGAFRARRCMEISGKTLLLVDDVFTTGSTMNLCAKELIHAGAEEVCGISAAKTRFSNN